MQNQSAVAAQAQTQPLLGLSPQCPTHVMSPGLSPDPRELLLPSLTALLDSVAPLHLYELTLCHTWLPFCPKVKSMYATGSALSTSLSPNTNAIPLIVPLPHTITSFLCPVTCPSSGPVPCALTPPHPVYPCLLP